MTSWTDPNFSTAMKELAPAGRAGFLAIAYKQNPEEFNGITPDEILIREFDTETYVKLASQKLVPIAAAPAGIMLG